MDLNFKRATREKRLADLIVAELLQLPPPDKPHPIDVIAQCAGDVFDTLPEDERPHPDNSRSMGRILGYVSDRLQARTTAMGNLNNAIIGLAEAIEQKVVAA